MLSTTTTVFPDPAGMLPARPILPLAEARTNVQEKFRLAGLDATYIGDMDLYHTLESNGNDVETDPKILEAMDANDDLLVSLEREKAEIAARPSYGGPPPPEPGDVTDISPYEKCWFNLRGDPAAQDIVERLFSMKLTGHIVRNLQSLLTNIKPGEPYTLRKDITSEDISRDATRCATEVVHSVKFMTETYKLFPGRITMTEESFTASRVINGVHEEVKFIRGVPATQGDADLASEWVSGKGKVYKFPFQPAANVWLGAFQILFEAGDGAPIPGSACTHFNRRDPKGPSTPVLGAIERELSRLVDNTKEGTTLVDVVNLIQGMLSSHVAWHVPLETMVGKREAQFKKATSLNAMIRPPFDAAAQSAVIAELNNEKAARNIGVMAHIRHRVVNPLAASVYDAPHWHMAKAFWKRIPDHAVVHGRMSTFATYYKGTALATQRFIEMPFNVTSTNYSECDFVLFASPPKKSVASKEGHPVLRLLDEVEATIKAGAYVAMVVNVLSFPASGTAAQLDAMLANYDFKPDMSVNAGSFHTPEIIMVFQRRADRERVPIGTPVSARSGMSAAVGMALAIAYSGNAYFRSVLAYGDLTKTPAPGDLGVLTGPRNGPGVRTVLSRGGGKTYLWDLGPIIADQQAFVIGAPSTATEDVPEDAV